MRLREVRLEPCGALQLGNRVFVALLIRKQNPELQKSLRELGIKRDGSSQQRFHLPQISGGGRLPLPQAHRIVELRQRVSRMRFRESREATSDLAAQRRRDA